MGRIYNVEEKESKSQKIWGNNAKYHVQWKMHPLQSGTDMGYSRLHWLYKGVGLSIELDLEDFQVSQTTLILEQ